VQVPLTREDVLHPQEDDHLMHNPAHDRDCNYLKNALLWAVNDRQDAEVLQDVRVDWGKEGVKPHGPDLSVFVEIHKAWERDGGTFLVAEVEAKPILVIEVTSPATRDIDLDEKVLEYFQAGVPFYAIVDSRREQGIRQVRILGYRATPDGYLRLPLDAQGRLWLEPVKLWLAGGPERAVCFDEQGVRIPDFAEAMRNGRQAEAQNEELRSAVEEAITARQQAEKRVTDLAARLAELEAELQRHSGQG
jgi:Uma2 family endonuclease